ncbi:hypothetical protein DY000_02058351 [Brassica cretica]|uniref:DUF4005 domain-containing protein n=1 Tax=Brassica cretica TaxID=69181 RepID=A0ABQ7AGW7_BRACR|nr:hypothetical protein DY000_02058351 [Brassica cretica]
MVSSLEKHPHDFSSSSHEDVFDNFELCYHIDEEHLVEAKNAMRPLKVWFKLIATASAKARVRGQGSPRFGQEKPEKNGITRRHSSSWIKWEAECNVSKSSQTSHSFS